MPNGNEIMNNDRRKKIKIDIHKEFINQRKNIFTNVILKLVLSKITNFRETIFWEFRIIKKFFDVNKLQNGKLLFFRLSRFMRHCFFVTGTSNYF